MKEYKPKYRVEYGNSSLDLDGRKIKRFGSYTLACRFCSSLLSDVGWRLWVLDNRGVWVAFSQRVDGTLWVTANGLGVLRSIQSI